MRKILMENEDKKVIKGLADDLKVTANQIKSEAGKNELNVDLLELLMRDMSHKFDNVQNWIDNLITLRGMKEDNEQ